MAHKKSGSTKAKQGGNVAGKRLGIKVYGGSAVQSGSIIVRQRGREFIPGLNTGMGTDYTIFSKIVGIVRYIYDSRKKKRVDVIEGAK